VVLAAVDSSHNNRTLFYFITMCMILIKFGFHDDIEVLYQYTFQPKLVMSVLCCKEDLNCGYHL
jgi:hypothetical protein